MISYICVTETELIFDGHQKEKNVLFDITEDGMTTTGVDPVAMIIVFGLVDFVEGARNLFLYYLVNWLISLVK
jgi:hypothetical protein